MELFDFSNTNLKDSAIFSEDRKYRYSLTRVWDDSKPMILFLGLNPSTANEINDDPTIRRIKKFAFDWGYGGIHMLNCFPLVSPDPLDLIFFKKNHQEYKAEIQINDSLIYRIWLEWPIIVFCWGSFSIVRELCRDQELHEMFPKAFCFGKNANGSPKHPLYLKSDTKLIKY